MRIIFVLLIVLICSPILAMQRDKLKVDPRYSIQKKTKSDSEVCLAEIVKSRAITLAYCNQLKRLEWATGFSFRVAPKDPASFQIIKRYCNVVVERAYTLRKPLLSSERIGDELYQAFEIVSHNPVDLGYIINGDYDENVSHRKAEEIFKQIAQTLVNDKRSSNQGN